MFPNLTNEQIQELQRKQEEKLKSEVMSIIVYDAEWDHYEYRDIGGFDVREDGVLIIGDRESQTVALYNHDKWAQVQVSREPRLESTDDEPKDDDDAPADLGDPRLS